MKIKNHTIQDRVCNSYAIDRCNRFINFHSLNIT